MPDNAEITSLIADVREQVLYMQELGIDALDVHMAEAVRAAEPAAAAVSPAREVVRPEKTAPPPDLAIPARPISPAAGKRAPGSRIAALPSLAKREPRKVVESETSETGADKLEKPKKSLEEPLRRPEEPVRRLEEPIYGLEKAVVTRSENLEDTGQAGQMGQGTEGQAAIVGHGTTDTIESIRAEIGDCTRCPLHALGRTQIVHSTGNFNAQLMFVGEAPGADEDEQGFPFVGRAGQLLTKIIESIGMSRDEVFIGNINRCRPPGNRAPEPVETAACRPFLLREIAVLKPKVVVVLGATAAHNLLQVKTPISKLRGHFHDHLGVKVMPTFHPAYLLRDPHKKREVWEDMKMVRDFLTS